MPHAHDVDPRNALANVVVDVFEVMQDGFFRNKPSLSREEAGGFAPVTFDKRPIKQNPGSAESLRKRTGRETWRGEDAKMSGLGIVGKSQNPYLAMMDFSCFPISAIAACCAGSFSVKRVPVAASRTSIEVSSAFSDSRM